MSNEASLAMMAQTIQELTQALKQSDLRQRKTERLLRWGTLSLMLIVTLGLYVGVDPSRAHAESTLRKELSETGQLLQNLNMIVGDLAQQIQQKDSPTRLFLSDISTLATRLKKDSDSFRRQDKKASGGKMTTLQQNLIKELKLLNEALASVPVMATEMQKMSANMAAINYSIGSTMGRMGNILPW